jgi:uncharacterized delta-60 repeat protein
MGIASSFDSVAIQPDGKIVVLANTTGAAYLRLMPDGMLDPSFGAGGVASPLPASFTAQSLSIDPSGMILTTALNGGAEGLVRLKTDGSLDGTFPQSSGNVQSTPFVRPDSEILSGLLGSSFATGPQCLATLFTSGGAVDMAFGNLGTASVEFGSASCAQVALEADQSNRVLIAGAAQATPTSPNAFGIARLTPVGASDSTFGTTGWTTTSFPNDSATPVAMGIQPDGRIVLVGNLEDASGQSPVGIALARYLP